MNIVIDFETRSPVNIKLCGSAVYAAHPDTEVVMLAVLKDDELGRVWIAPKFRYFMDTEISDEELTYLITEAEKIAAHNAPFERYIWKHKMEPLGFPSLPVEKVHCTMSRALMCGLPRNLEQAMKAWRPDAPQKDAVGHRLMLKMSQPRKFLKKELGSIGGGDPLKIKEQQILIYDILSEGNIPDVKEYHGLIVYHEKKEEFKRLVKYARNDVIAERILFTELPEMQESEREVWLLDQKINDRGIGIDRESIHDIKSTIARYEQTLFAEAVELTCGEVENMKSTKSVIKWLENQGVHTTSIDKENVEELLTREISSNVRRFLEIRQSLGKSSNAKYNTMLCCSTVDSRARGTMIYHGASTGRFAGALFQPHNLPKTSTTNKILPSHIKPEEYFISEEDILLLSSQDIELIQEFWKDPLVLASDSIRSMLIPKDGHDFVCADFSAIEGRGLAWLAGEEHILKAYREGKDLYKVTASGIYRIPYEQVDGGGKGYQRAIGKICELALGFGGGYWAMLRFGADKMGIDEEEGKEIVRKWRENRHKTVDLWARLVSASIETFKTGKPVYVKGIVYQRGKRFLRVTLPSGRFLYYPDPKLEKIEMQWSTSERPAFKELVTAMTLTATKQYVRRPLNHLILCENVIQALCRDLLVDSLFRVESAGYPVVMHVHDEIVSEVPKDFGSLKEFEDIMSVCPEWAKDFPIKAEGWRGKRYRK